MAYLLYAKRAAGDGDEYAQLRATALGGNRSGIISRYLRRIAASATSEPWAWHLPMDQALRELENDAGAFIIDLKPANAALVSLYEVRNIWGFTSSGWTPLMLELETLLVDEDAKAFNKTLFRVPKTGRDQVVTFLYLDGGVHEGELTRTWNFPGPSSTNSVLLWPEALAYFMKQVGYQDIAAASESSAGAQPDRGMLADPANDADE